MEDLPFYIDAVFILTTFLILWFLYKVTNSFYTPIGLFIVWLALQAVISRTGFYTITNGVPPRFMLLVLPPFLGIIILFTTPGGRRFIHSLNQEYLTLLHVVRIPVEWVLYTLYLHGKVPEIMTFAGKNFDILSGLSAPLIWYFGYKRKVISNTVKLLWNVLCLALLINIVYHAIFSAPFVFQRYAFDQPNVAVLYFPFTWLPGVIVPIVLFAHLATIYQLLTTQRGKKR